MIRYDRLWDTMTNRGMTQYKLIKFHGFSAGQIGRLKKNMHVSTHTLETLCRLLDCRIEDIVEYRQMNRYRLIRQLPALNLPPRTLYLRSQIPLQSFRILIFCPLAAPTNRKKQKKAPRLKKPQKRALKMLKNQGKSDFTIYLIDIVNQITYNYI